MRVLLAQFEDPDTYNSFEKPCRCDNCQFPDRIQNDRLLPPPQLSLTEAEEKSLNLMLRKRWREELRVENSEILEERAQSIETH